MRLNPLTRLSDSNSYMFLVLNSPHQWPIANHSWISSSIRICFIQKMRNFQLNFAVLMLIFLWRSRVQSKCSKSCDSLASYKVWNGTNMTFISDMFGTSIDNILSFNPQVPSKDLISFGSRINVPFKCNCINGQFLAQNFSYKIKSHDTYKKVAQTYYANLTTVDWLKANNIFPENNIPDVDTSINVIMNCSCGDKRVSKDYGLFVTYPIEPGENLGTIANMSSLRPELLQSYNRDSNFSSGLVFIPGKDQSGNYPPLKISRDAGMSRRVISGIAVGGVSGILFLAFFVYFGFYRRKKEESVLPEATEKHHIQHGSASTLEKTSETVALVASPGLTSISVDKSVEFSYEELAKATDDFNMAYMIGQGGFGAVYYAELGGEKAAIKKMDMQASKEFLAELKVLTHVHHLNLVRLIGYCFEGSLCVVYEFIENGNLSQHLRGCGMDPLPWSTRLQIALDSARGLEYIHEHTVPVYIHRDIKSANILIDKNFRAKVADFGLTKLAELGNAPLYSGLRGTIGYIPPECVCGNVSPKTDVYAFGVVLYELISAKGAVVTTKETMTQSKGLVALFKEVLNQPDPREDLWKLVDPKLGDNYPLDSVIKLAVLAKACTQEDPQLRPSMRKVVVALATLSSSTEDWDIGSLNENPTLVNLMSGK